MTQASGHPISASKPLPTDSDKAVFWPPALLIPETSCGPNSLCADPHLPKPVNTMFIDSVTLSVRSSLKPLKTKSLLSSSLFDLKSYCFLEASQSFSIQIV